MNKRIVIISLLLVSIIIFTSCTSKTTFTCPPGQILQGKSCIQSTICGNRLCETGENSQLCAIDCQRACQSDYCNNQVQIVCSQNNCGESEKLFPHLLTLQSRTVSCLSQYFTYTPPRITYEIQTGQARMCSQEEGCCCTEGGLTSVQGIQITSLNGLTPKSQTIPTKPEYLLADEHETTHFFLNHMLGTHPTWFSEAIAIQTNERAACDTKVLTNADQQVVEYSKRGDVFLLETSADQRSFGVRLDDGSYLNTTYYYKFKKGTSRLSNREKFDPHITGTLWIIGLKEDYNCTDTCIKRILKELQTYVRDQCTINNNCEGQIVTNKVIYDATKKVVEKDPYALFQLLEIKS